MELNQAQISKIDTALQETLVYAQHDEMIRVIIVLRTEEASANSVLMPSQFASRQAFRQALINQRRQQMSIEVEDTLESLRRLSSKTLGDSVSPVIVFEGNALQILRALELPGVHYVSLDRLISLPELIPSTDIEYISDIYVKTLDQKTDKSNSEAITQSAEQYILNYHKKYGKLQILGMQESIKLESIFTSVQFLKQPSLKYSEDLDLDNEKNEVIEESKKGESEKFTKLSGIKIAREENYLMVLGAPGSGKSTFLCKIGLEAFKNKKGQYSHGFLPVLIELKNIVNTDFTIKDKIVEEFNNCHFPLANEFVINAINNGQLLILLDGLDEVPSNSLKFVCNQIKKLLKECHKNTRIICSCRTASYKNIHNLVVNFADLKNPENLRLNRSFRNIEIASFDDNQIFQFIQSWFYSEIDIKEKTFERCWNLLNSYDHRATKILAKTPLLLTFICLVYDRTQDWPKNRSGLYGKALDILLERWWSEKRVQIEPIYRHLGIEFEKRMLSKIAYKSFRIDQHSFPRVQLVEEIQDFLINDANSPTNLDADSILDAIAIQQGILVEEMKDIYSFSHLTIHEYLTAYYISQNDQIEQLVDESLIDQRWREVFLLVAGLMRGTADRLLLLLRDKAQNYVNSSIGMDYLFPLLRWVERVTVGSKINLNEINKRCLAVVFASANAFAYAYANSFSRAIPQAFELAYPPFHKPPAPAHAFSYAFFLANVYTLTCSYYPESLVETYANAYRLLYAFALAKAYSNALSFNIQNCKNYNSALQELIGYARELQKEKIFNDQINFDLLTSRLENMKNTVPKSSNDLNYHNDFSNKIINTWFNAFLLDQKIFDISKTTLKKIDENYSYINWLIVHCKKASVSVSKKTWEEIESQILTVPSH
jgi:hypothetical protein